VLLLLTSVRCTAYHAAAQRSNAAMPDVSNA
jgi:hypothetical protein